ncbi:MAG: hypothetical protein ABL995_19345 [Bryobacteraceae bacterium]
MQMKTLARRLQRLEDRSGVGPDTEADIRLRVLLEEGRQRVADARAFDGLPPLDTAENEQENLSGLTTIEILNRGRARVAAQARLAKLSTAREISPA